LPSVHRSAGTAFSTACSDLSIEDLHFHDLHHERTSRLFESGFAIQRLALMTGHKDSKMLGRYTHLRPETFALCGGQAWHEWHVIDN
jgi:integrase